MDTQHTGAAPERVDFSKIKTSIPIPNLIEVQKKSYERFLQMDLAAERARRHRSADRLQQRLPDLRFPRRERARVRRLLDRQLGVQVRQSERACITCAPPAATVAARPSAPIRSTPGDVLCHQCGTFNKNIVTFCNSCGDPVGLQLKYDVQECQERGMTYAAPLKVTIRLTVYDKDPETGRQEHPRHQGTGSLLRRNSADDRQRHVHHQRHRARHRQPVAPLARRVLRARAGAGLLPRQDHSVSRKLGGVRVRQQEPAVRPYRPQAQVLRHGIPARARPEDRRRDSARLLPASASIDIKDKKLFWKVDREPDRPEALARHHQPRAARPWSRRARRSPTSLFKEISEGQDRRRWKSPPNDLEGAYVAADVIDMATGEVLIEANHELTADDAQQADRSRHQRVRSLLPGARRRRQRDLGHASQGRRSRRRTTRCSKSTASCVPAIRRPWIPPPSCSRACSSTRASTISRAWAA